MNSTLSGLGSGHLDTICSRYKNHLQNLWSAFNPDGGPAPEGVAELTLGLWVHKYVDEKSKEVDRILNHGKRRRKAVLQPDGKKFPTEIEIEDVSRAKIPSGKSLGATSQKKEEMSRHRGKISRALGGMAAISDKVTAREKARKKDMLRRAKPWTDQLGISDLLIFSNSNNILEQEDMPVIPNLT